MRMLVIALVLWLRVIVPSIAAENQPAPSDPDTLSDKLDRGNGVIVPPATGDSEIETTVPEPNPGTTKVIPPPGTPGGNQTIQPK